jgi:hypothetical protein
VVLEPARHDFERWYAVHRAWLGLPELERGRLQDFHRDVIEPLGRVPRVEFLLPLLEGYAMLGADDAWLQVAARTLGPSDLGLLWFSEPWEEARERLESPPCALGRSGLAPYACADAMLEGDDFARWYLVYGPRLGLAARDREFLEELGARLVKPLDRVPRPPLLQALADLWAARDTERGRIEQRSAALTAHEYNAARDEADRRLRDELRRVLHPLDWNRIRHSRTWRSLFHGLGN